MVPPRRNDGEGLPRSLYADGWLMDRQIVDVDALPVDKVDDLEFTDPSPGQEPALTGLVRAAGAGPRIGGRLGRWWTAVGWRLRDSQDTGPVRIPAEQVTGERPLSVTG